MTDELHYRLLQALESNPQATQRDLARDLGISLGGTNYRLRAVIDRGWVTMQNFRNRNNKRAYAYRLTPDGIDAKARIAVRFLKRKRSEYEALKVEIEQLAAEVEQHLAVASVPVQDHAPP